MFRAQAAALSILAVLLSACSTTDDSATDGSSVGGARTGPGARDSAATPSSTGAKNSSATDTQGSSISATGGTPAGIARDSSPNGTRGTAAANAQDSASGAAKGSGSSTAKSATTGAGGADDSGNEDDLNDRGKGGAPGLNNGNNSGGDSDGGAPSSGNASDAGDNGNNGNSSVAGSPGSGDNSAAGGNNTSAGGRTPKNCTPVTCESAGKNCGPISDGCGGIVQCGTCTAPQCCGCGGIASVCGGTKGNSTSGGGTTVAATCIAGTKGCLCDSMGNCAPGLTCAPQKSPDPNLCCEGSDCTPPSASIGGSCGDTNVVSSCTPGVRAPDATGNNDNCGYAASSFNESVILCAISASGGGTTPAQIQVFYNDEHALPLGCENSNAPVSALPSNPGAVYYPQTGDPDCKDTSGRPLRPVLFITDISNDANCRAGDQQQGGPAYDPIAVFGTWKSADTSGTPGTNPTPLNYWDLGSAADPVPNAATTACPCAAGSCITTGHTGRGYGTELRFEAGLISGHSYRLQIMMHDGDQTQGGDSAEACAVFCAGTGNCTPTGKCGEGCGQIPDGCGGLIDCGPCCTPQTCEDACAGQAISCATDKDSTHTESCPQADGCGDKIPCWCVPML